MANIFVDLFVTFGPDIKRGAIAEIVEFCYRVAVTVNEGLIVVNRPPFQVGDRDRIAGTFDGLSDP